MKRGKAEGVMGVYWSGLIGCWLVFVFFAGGIAQLGSLLQQFIALSSFALILIGLWRLRSGFPSLAALFAALLAAASLGLVLLHLVPVPYDVWRTLPGRELIAKTHEALALSPELMAFSLSPVATRAVAISMLVPLAAFICTLSIPRREMWFLGAAVAVTAALNFGLGLLQEGFGIASNLFFHGETAAFPIASGTFANHNFFAAQIYSSIPFIAALVMTGASRWPVRPILIFVLTVVWVGMLIALLAVVGSRAGIILAMLAVLLTFSLVFRLPQQSTSSLALRRGVFLAMAALVVIAQTSMLGILQLVETDPVNEIRTTINRVSLGATLAYMPWGSGFGTFVPVYQLFETPEVIVNNYVNHAHNDWLELLLEGGLPAAGLLALFVTWFIYIAVKVLRLSPHDPANAYIKAALVTSILLLLHSAVDYPLREFALAALFGMCLALLSRVTERPSQMQQAKSDFVQPRQIAPARKVSWKSKPGKAEIGTVPDREGQRRGHVFVTRTPQNREKK